MRIGRLEFEVLIEETAPVAKPTLEPESDAAGEEISDLLARADERERMIRQEHPELRVLHVESADKEAAEKASKEAAAAAEAMPSTNTSATHRDTSAFISVLQKGFRSS